MTREEFKELKIGDRIIALENTYYLTKGVCGTVVGTNTIPNGEIAVRWDDYVGGWRNEKFNIEDGHGEYIRQCSYYKIKKLPSKETNVHTLVITCKDGKHTTATYLVNNKVVSEASASRDEKFDEFNFKTAVSLCVKRTKFDNANTTRGEDLIGRTVRKGQRVRVISIKPHKDITDNKVCLDEYIGKEGIIYRDTVLVKNGFGSPIVFDKEYMNAIDLENGRLCWRWDEIELID